MMLFNVSAIYTYTMIDSGINNFQQLTKSFSTGTVYRLRNLLLYMRQRCCRHREYETLREVTQAEI